MNKITINGYVTRKPITLVNPYTGSKNITFDMMCYRYKPDGSPTYDMYQVYVDPDFCFPFYTQPADIKYGDILSVSGLFRPELRKDDKGRIHANLVVDGEIITYLQPDDRDLRPSPKQKEAEGK